MSLDAMSLLTTVARAILLLAAAAGFADRTGVAPAVWSAFVGGAG